MSEKTHLEIASAILSDAQRVETMGATVSGKLLNLFKECGSEEFEMLCTQAETDWKAKRAKGKADTTLPKCWTQAKSDIKGAVKAGVDVAACDTVSQAKRLKVAANKASKAAKPASAGAKGSSVAQPITAPTQDERTVSQAEVLLEKLSLLSAELREAMIDSFIAQTDKAIAASSDDDVSGEISKLEQHLAEAV